MHDVAIITRSFAPNIGGVETFAKQLRQSLIGEGFRVRVITQTPADTCQDCGGKNTIRIRGFFGYLAARKSHEVKVFVGVWFWPLMLEFFFRHRVILTHHNAYLAKTGWRVCVGVFKRQISKAFLNVFVSQSLKQEFGIKGAVLPNTYDADYLAGFGREPYDSGSCLRLIYVGRLVQDKGVDVAVAVAAKLINTQVVSQLVVVGDGPCRVELERQATALCCSHSIIFTGWRSQAAVRDLLLHSDLLLVPSKWREPFGIVVLEALAAGCGVIASNRGGLPEACGHAGIFVDPTEMAFITAVKQYYLASGQVSSQRQRLVKEHLDKHSPLRFAQRYSRIVRFVARRSFV